MSAARIGLALLFAAAGCSEKEAKPTAPEPTEPAEPPPPIASPKRGDAKVSLLEVGAEPRRKLRLKLGKSGGAKLEVRMTILELEDGEAGAVREARSKVVMTPLFELTWRGEAADVERLFDWVVLDYNTEDVPGVPAQVVSGLRSQLKRLVGTRGTGTIDRRGRHLETSLTVPPEADPALAKMMEGMRDAVATMSAPLPDEAVGVGGSWKVKQRMTQNGLTSDFDVTYRITAIDGDRVVAETTTEIVGVPGPIENALMPAGAETTLDSLRGSGTGTVTIDLASIVPRQATMTMTSEVRTTLRRAGESHPTVSRTKLIVEETRKP